jgi:cytochrome c5
MTSHHHSPSESGESNPIQLAILIMLGAIAVVIGIMLLVNYAVGSYGSRDLTGDPSMSPEAVAKRIAPVAQVKVDPNAPAATPAPAAAAPAAAPATPAPAAPVKTAAAGGAGKSTYDTACVACHGTGAAGAPKLGDKAAWGPRLAQGLPALHASALKGKGAMPPKGGNAALPDDAVKAAVDYMASAAK